MIVIFCLLLGLAIILSIVDTALIFQRINQKTTSSRESQASYRRESQLGPLLRYLKLKDEEQELALQKAAKKAKK